MDYFGKLLNKQKNSFRNWNTNIYKLPINFGKLFKQIVTSNFIDINWSCLIGLINGDNTAGAYKDGPEFCFRPKFSGPSTFAKKCFLARPYKRPLYCHY